MPKVTTGNRLYFYQLFSREIGIGKQVSISRIEEVLAAEDLEPGDLEFETTADLLAAMPEIVKLTVFKKGRTYATLIQNEEFDAILARLAAPAAAEKGAKGGPKTWKRKKGPKDPTPAKPRKRVVETKPAPVEAEAPAPEAVEEPEVVEEAAAEAAPDVEQDVITEPEPEESATEEDGCPAEEPQPEMNPMEEPDTKVDSGELGRHSADAPCASRTSSESLESTKRSGISLTITYDPREVELPWEEPAAAVEPELLPAPKPAVAPSPAPAPTSDRDLPERLSGEVLMRDEQLRVLYQLLPIDVDLMATLDEDWRVARSCGLVSGTRGKVTFPLRYLHENDGTPVTVTVKRSAKNPGGKRWTLAYVDGDDGTGTSHASAGVEGLPTADEGAWSDLSGSRRAAITASPVRELAQYAQIGSWDSTLGALATMAAPEHWAYPGESDRIAGRYGALREYLAVTFHRVRQENKLLVAEDESLAAFDTGLLTPFAEDIYAVMTPQGGDIAWKLGFAVAGSGELGMRLVEAFDPLPEPASYFSTLSDVMPEAGRMLILDTSSLLSTQLGRLPRAFLAEQLESNSQTRELLEQCVEAAGDGYFKTEQLTTLGRAIKADPGLYRRMGRALQDAVELSIRRARASYRIVAPTYDPADGRTKLLLPLCLVDDRRVDCAAVLALMPSGAYQVSAVLSLDRARTCARIACAERPSWLA